LQYLEGAHKHLNSPTLVSTRAKGTDKRVNITGKREGGSGKELAVIAYLNLTILH